MSSRVTYAHKLRTIRADAISAALADTKRRNAWMERLLLHLNDLASVDANSLVAVCRYALVPTGCSATCITICAHNFVAANIEALIDAQSAMQHACCAADKGTCGQLWRMPQHCCSSRCCPHRT
jgi:ABC-type antimicrobial peptide transport system ATPase subunit